MIHSLAQFFRGIHLAFGMTGIPDDATSQQEARFVLMWFGIVVLIIVWAALFSHWVGFW